MKKKLNKGEVIHRESCKLVYLGKGLYKLYDTNGNLLADQVSLEEAKLIVDCKGERK